MNNIAFVHFCRGGDSMFFKPQRKMGLEIRKYIEGFALYKIVNLVDVKGA